MNQKLAVAMRRHLDAHLGELGATSAWALSNRKLVVAVAFPESSPQGAMAANAMQAARIPREEIAR